MPAKLKLRRARVLRASPPEGTEQQLMIDLDGGRPAIADVTLIGVSEVGDEVVVNVQALDLGLGAGSFDIVHCNLTRGLQSEGEADPVSPHVIKLPYTSLQHAARVRSEERLELPLQAPVAVLALHEQLAAVAWAFAQAAPGLELGYVQTEGGALPGGHSRMVRSLRERGLLSGHLSAGAAYGGEGESLSTAAALHHGIHGLGWDAAVCGPGPGILGPDSSLEHGGMAALDSAHVALALGCHTLLVARMSSSDPREGHRGISNHTRIVLDLLLEPVTVALPAGMRSPVGSELRSSLGSVFAASSGRSTLELDTQRAVSDRPARIARHDWRRTPVDLPAFASSGLSRQTMGRSLTEDPLFFAAALAGGGVLAQLAGEERPQAEQLKASV